MRNGSIWKLGKNVVGVDVFDMPIRAIDYKKEVYIRESIENIYNEIPPKSGLIELKELFYNGKYVFEYEIMVYIFRALLKKIRLRLLKPSLVISVPYEFVASDWGNLWKKMIIEAATIAGWRKVFLIENFFAAALSVGIALGRETSDKSYDKSLVTYISRRCTYIGLVFAGNSFYIRTIEKNYNEISKEQLSEVLEEVKKSITLSVPEIFNKEINNITDMETIKRSWNQPTSRDVYVIAPPQLKHRIGLSMGDSSIIYNENYEDTIVKGLKKAIEILS